MAQTVQLNVSGMSCGHCVSAVENSVGDLDGVSSVKVSLNPGLVDISFDDNKVSLETIKSTIVEEGYEVQ